MRTQHWLLILSLTFALLASAQTQPTPVESAPPPGAPAKRSAAELEKLVAPIALYPDPLIATLLPASVYPLEVVQAARFVADTNNLAKLDAQPWDDSVKAVARVPDAIKKLNDDLPWTIALGEAFLAQDKEVMDMIQTLRGKAQKAGTLQTTQQQVIVVTNMIVETRIEQQVVVVTNTVVQIQSASPQVVYVPTYNPYTVYYPPPAYVYNPYAPLVTFAAGVAMGAIIANNCDWHHGGCYHGNVDVDIDINRNINNNFNRNNSINTGARGTGTAQTRAAGTSATGTPKKWQPDSNRLSKSGSPGATASARSMESRGWGSTGATRPSTGTVGARPSTGTPAARPSTGTAAARPSSGSSSANRPTASPSTSRQSPSPAASPSRSGTSPNRSSSSGSAFGGVSGGSGASNYGSRGASSRGFSGGGRAGGGGRGGRR